MIYLASGIAALSAILAAYRPSIWSMLAAGILNSAAAWLAVNVYLGG